MLSMYSIVTKQAITHHPKTKENKEKQDQKQTQKTEFPAQATIEGSAISSS